MLTNFFLPARELTRNQVFQRQFAPLADVLHVNASQRQDGVAHPNLARGYHACAPAPVSTDRRIPTFAKHLFHTAAGCADHVKRYHRPADPNLPPLQRGKVDTGYHKIAPQQCSRYRPPPHDGTDHRQMLCLYQCHGALAGARMVTLQPILANAYFGHCRHLGPACGSDADPVHLPRLRKARDQALQIRHRHPIY